MFRRSLSALFGKKISRPCCFAPRLEKLETRELLSGGMTLEYLAGNPYFDAVYPNGGSDAHGAVVRFNPNNGDTQRVSDNAIQQNLKFAQPADLIREPINGTGYLTVVDPIGGSDGHGDIVRINPTTGGTQKVSDNSIQHNVKFVHPTGITLMPINGNGYLTVVDPSGGSDGHGQIVLINPTTGGTQLISDNNIQHNVKFVHPTGITLESINGNAYLSVADPTGGSD